MQTVRTTIRLRKDLIDQSKMIAFKKGIPLQEVINDTLALGFGHVSNLDGAREAMKRIDAFRESLVKKNIQIDVKKLLAQNKRDQK